MDAMLHGLGFSQTRLQLFIKFNQVSPLLLHLPDNPEPRSILSSQFGEPRV